MKQDTFKQYPNLKSYFKTTDGVRFFNESDAKNHARTLQNKTVEQVKRTHADDTIGSNDKEKVKKNTGASGKSGKKSDSKKPNALQAAKQRIADIENMDTVAAVEEALKGETAKTVKEAGEKRIEAINTAAASAAPSDEEE